ncbi:hypothetical protein FRC10_011314 [Ceratobasidium sp. 414]|nr:hypothetical protein FRC10_011314 [Ceratobasidium sp. 414]
MADVPSPSASLIEIPPTEYPDYSFRCYDRLFPRLRLPQDRREEPGADLSCILPVDSREMERRTVQHNLVHLALGSHTFGPFEECMTPRRNKVVLDIGSDSGKWYIQRHICRLLSHSVLHRVEDVSDELSHEPRFHGVELVPLSPTDTPNVYFEVYDFQQDRIRQEASTFDVVHARFQNFHILDWQCFLGDVARVLKPGGLFMSGELNIPLQYANDQQFPATIHLYGQVVSAMLQRGYTPNVGESMPAMLEALRSTADNNTPLFTNVGSQIIDIPVGCNPPVPDQVELSVLAMDCLMRLSSSLKPLLLSRGSNQVEVNGLVTAHRQELNEGNATMTYRVTWAQRR